MGIVGEGDGGIGKAEAVELPLMVHTSYDGNVSVGYEGHALLFLLVCLRFLFCPVIIVLGNEDLISSTQFLLHIEYSCTNPLVEDVGTLVAPGHHHGIIDSTTAETALERIYQFVSIHDLYVWHALDAKAGECQSLLGLGQHLSQHGGVP